MAMEKTWRWFGPNDPIQLHEIVQTGATGIVTALHHLPNGEVWKVEEIQKRKKEIEDAGLTWSVVESVPVHEDIKKQKGNFEQYIENYKTTIRNLGQCGINTVCYNFMPVLDWTRTTLDWAMYDGTHALKYDAKLFAAFDLFILARPGAEKEYTSSQKSDAEKVYQSLSKDDVQKVADTILKGLPGSEEDYSLNDFLDILKEYDGIDSATLKSNLHHFLKEVIPVAEEAGVRMAIHPDDPPWSLLGLPRVVSRLEDVHDLLDAVNSPYNGITLCTGSYGSGYFNDLPAITREAAHRINFVHLRNVKRDQEHNFNEDHLLEGDVDVFEVLRILLMEQSRRRDTGREDWQIPIRPDHGNRVLDDFQRKTNPGYSLYGRMKGLAEIKGMEWSIQKMLNLSF